jgi:acyl-CoA hydrolase/L-amino acid N-acyltransferase YncA
VTWGSELDERTLTAEAAAALIGPGDRVFVGTACATPRSLVAALEARSDAPAGVTLVHALTDRVGREGADGQLLTRYRHRVFYVGTDVRDLLPTGRVDYVPVSLADVPAMFADGQQPIDVALVQVSPPDEDGMCSLGVSVDVTRAAVQAASTVIAEINPAMPRTGGDSLVPARRLDHVVPVDTPVTEYVHPPAEGVAEQIARYVARLVDDRSTLQVGPGRVPNEMLRHLLNRRNLSVHTEVVTEPVAELVLAGVVTGKVVGSWAMGTRRLYDLLGSDGRFSLHRIEHVCDPEVIGRHDRMVSVTQAFSIDLSGQVCTENLDGRLYGGVSASPEFHRGALRARRGTPVVCLASRSPSGRTAFRVALGPTEPVALTRAEQRWVVTEYGTAYLHGKSLAERALALVEIAHPDDREELLAAARECGILAEGQRLRSHRAYPVEEERALTLRDGRDVLVRPTRAVDRPALQALFHRLPEQDVHTRFFTKLNSLTDRTADHLCNVDYEEDMAFAVVVGPPAAERIVATSSYHVNARDGFAEVAYLVDPAWQRTGLASALHARTVEYARSHGVRGLTADVLVENDAMMTVFRRGAATGHDLEIEIEDGIFELRMRFTDGHIHTEGTS